MWGALIGAGASLLGSVFGGGSKKQETTNYVDYKRMVRDAEAAGFNPLTALRNGGAAGYSVSSTPATPLSARIADGVAGATQSFLQNFDPFADQKREAEFSIVQAQVANLNADTALKHRTGLGSVPSYTAGNMKRTLGAGIKHGQTFKSVADALPPSAGISQTPTVEQTTVTNPFPTKWGVQVNSAVPDAAAYEERYGDSEIFQMIYGAGIGIADLGHNVDRGMQWLHDEYSPRGKRLSKARKDRLSRDHIPEGFNIYGEPPALTSRRYKTLQ